MPGRPAATSYWAACVLKDFLSYTRRSVLVLVVPAVRARSLLVGCESAGHVHGDVSSGQQQGGGAGHQQQSRGVLLSCVTYRPEPRVEPGIGCSFQLHCEFHLAQSDGSSARPSRFASFACSPMSRPPPLWRWKGQEGAACSVLAPVNTALGALPNAEQCQVSFRGCAGVSSVQPSLLLLLPAGLHVPPD